MSNNIICLWFPYLSVETAFKNEPEFTKKPFSTIEEYKKRQILHSINPFGRSLGLKPGLGLYEAHTLCENLKTEKRDYKKELASLKMYAKWCYQLTPRVSVEKENTIMLNIEGCTRLFGNTSNILKIINKNFKNINITVFSSLGETSSIAKSLVKFNTNKKITTRCDRKIRRFYYIPSKKLNTNNSRKQKVIINKPHVQLNLIPIDALNLTSAETSEMKYLGIETISDLQNLGYQSIAIRFGPQIVENLKKFIGINPELTSFLKIKKPYSNSIRLPEPIRLIPDIQKLFEKLIISVCNYLKINNKGTRNLKIDFHEAYNRKKSIKIQTSEFTSDSVKFIELLNLKLHLIKSEIGIDFIRVVANKVETLLPIQNSLNLSISNKTNTLKKIVEKEEYKDLISRLGNRLGFDSLIYLHPNESHIPEKNVIKVSAAYCLPASFWPESRLQRPSLIFKPEVVKVIKLKKTPTLFVWRQRKYNVIISFGPERIAPEWWFDDCLWRTGLRDYWKIETACGTRLWLFETKNTEFKGIWFIHGTFI